MNKARNQKAASILRTIDNADLAKVQGGNSVIIIITPPRLPPPGACTGCGLVGAPGGPRLQ